VRAPVLEHDRAVTAHQRVGECFFGEWPLSIDQPPQPLAGAAVSSSAEVSFCCTSTSPSRSFSHRGASSLADHWRDDRAKSSVPSEHRAA
jgi:hypothetical protein